MISVASMGYASPHTDRAFHDATFNIPAGSVTTIVGGCNADASLACRLLSGTLSPTSGTITGIPDTVAYVPAHLPTDAPMTADAYLTHMGRLRGLTTEAARTRAQNLLQDLELVGHLASSLRELSVENRKKVIIAAAFLVPADLVVLDRPWEFLSTPAQNALMVWLRSVADNGGYVVIADSGETRTWIEPTVRLRAAEGALTDRVTPQDNVPDVLRASPSGVGAGIDVWTRGVSGWVEHAWGRVVVDVQELHGGTTSRVLRVLDADGESAVLRLYTDEPFVSAAERLLERETQSQSLAGRLDVAVPRTLSVDTAGTSTGHPAHLMTWLPGHVTADISSPGALRRMAAVLAGIHDLDPGDHITHKFTSWAHPRDFTVPDWATDPDAWKWAFDLLNDGREPLYDRVLLHRDFHLGNVLWTGEQLTGVVDWQMACWGPPELDVAHCCTNLAALHGEDAASAFRESYQGFASTPLPRVRWWYWHVMDLVGFLPNPGMIADAWRARGHDITVDDVHARFDARLIALRDAAR